MDSHRALRIQDYPGLLDSLQTLSEDHKTAALRYLARTDLYFLLRYLLNRKDVEDPWLLERIREVEGRPDGFLDLWARGHYKSTIITFAKTIQDVLAAYGNDPLPVWHGLEPTFCIFSHNRPIAKAFLRQIKYELELNEDLKDLFPDILYAHPARAAPKWGEDTGLIVKRHSNPKESVIEAWGLVDGQPTSKHFNVLVYDDVVTKDSVSTPEMIQKTTTAWELSLNLGSRNHRKRYIGTRYHYADPYKAMMDRNAAEPRLYPGTHDGTVNGKPVFLTEEEMAEKYREMGHLTFAAQILVNPIIDSTQSFKRDDLRFYRPPVTGASMNVALLCDPANEKHKKSDWTAMVAIGKGPDHNYYLLRALRDRLSLQERAKALMDMHRALRADGCKGIKVGYEKYGKDADIDYIKECMARESYHFDIKEVAGKLGKIDRIARLLPIVADHRFYMPPVLWYTTHERKTVDLIEQLINEEIMAFPVPIHDDMLDAITRIFDITLPWPKGAVGKPKEKDRYSERSETTWLSA